MTEADREPFAEIVQSSLQSWMAQSWQWDCAPAYGSLVAVEAGQRTFIGVVHEVATGSSDQSRHPFTYRKTPEELQEQQPRILEFLRTTFTCFAAGYQERGSLFYLLAPTPPKIHAFVRPLAPDIAKRFLASDQYLSLLFSHAGLVTNVDELLLAMLRYQASLGGLTSSRIARFVQTYSLLAGNDYRRTRLFLSRAQLVVQPA